MHAAKMWLGLLQRLDYMFVLLLLFTAVASVKDQEEEVTTILQDFSPTTTATILFHSSEPPINSSQEIEETIFTTPPPILEIVGLVNSNQTMEGLLYSTIGDDDNNSMTTLPPLGADSSEAESTTSSSLSTESLDEDYSMTTTEEEEESSTLDNGGEFESFTTLSAPMNNDDLIDEKVNSSTVGSFIDFLFNKVTEFVHNDTFEADFTEDEFKEEYSLEYFQDDAPVEMLDMAKTISLPPTTKETWVVAESTTKETVTTPDSTMTSPTTSENTTTDPETTTTMPSAPESTTTLPSAPESTTSSPNAPESTMTLPTTPETYISAFDNDQYVATGSPEYRFIFPPEPEDTTVSMKTEESVLVNEAGIPRVCISYVDTLRRSFVNQINQLLTNTSASCIPVENEPVVEKPCVCQETTTTTTTTTSTTTTTTEATTTTTMQITTEEAIQEDIVFSENSTLRFHLQCHKSFSAELKHLNFEIQILSPSPLLILTQFARLPSLKTYEDYRLTTNSNLTTLRDLSNGTFIKIICLCEEELGGHCLGDVSAFETEIKKVSFLSDAPLIVEEPFPELQILTPVLLCDDRCYIHGSCFNGTCTCNHGWNGKHCTLPGCQNNCGHGECVLSEEEWGCSCEKGWEGEFCEFPLELSCSDKIDNDNDGLVDCQDPECCISDPVCSLSQLCLTVDDPENILNRNESVHTFFDGILPLLDRNTGIQRYARANNFSPSRISVIRGRIVTKKTGSGLPGVRISRENSLGEGFTLSRKDGRFDFVTNGGNLAVLKFGKSPFPFVSRRIHIPSNQILDIGSVVLDSEDDWSLTMSPQEVIKYCPDHIYGNLSVKGLALPPKSPNTLTLGMEGSVNLGLVYQSESNATRIGISLINGKPPSSLMRVHLEIRIGGGLVRRLLEPEEDLNVDYLWDRRDVYGRTVYGKAAAFIRAGYEYSNCIYSPIWNTKTLNHIQASLIPKDMSGINRGWNLNILHRLEPVSRMLYKGDGSVHDLEQSRFHARLQEFASGEKGNKPIGVLINSRDDSIIVGFSSSIKMYSPDGKKSHTLLRLNASSEENRYFMALNPMNEDIYVSLPSEKIVLRIKDTEVDHELDEYQNYEIIAGNRKKCRSVHSCGNGGPANDSSLIYPKGIDIASDGTIYLADGRSIRTISHGIIESLGNSEKPRGYEWRPPFSECNVNWQTQDLDLRWPTDLALNPLDENTLIYVDDGDVFEYVIDSRVARPLFAAPTWCSDVSRRSLAYLEEDTTSVEYDQKGNLHLVVNRLINSHSTEKSGIMTLNAENRLISTLPIRDRFDIPKYEFDFISDLAVANDGSYFICDFENERVYRLSYGELSLNFENKYEVPSPEDNEIYSFSEQGMHLETRALFTDSPLISFLYDNFNNIIGVTNLYKSTLELVRDYEDAQRPVRRINIDGKLSHDIQVSDDYMVNSIRFPSGNILSFGYDKETLLWKLENGKLRTMYEYDSSGFYLQSIHPDGTSDDDVREHKTCNNFIEVQYETQSLPGRSSNKMREVVLPHTYSEDGFELEWSHYVRASSRSFDSFNGIGKHFIVNGKRSFSLEMHPRSGIQSIYDGGSISKRLLRVEEFYVPPRRLWIPEIDTGLSVVDETFTRDRMLSSVKWDDTFVHFIYDGFGRIVSVNSSGRVGEFIYDSIRDTYPSTVITPNGAEYFVFRDGSGGLASIVTPSNHSFHFHLVPMIGYYLMTFKPPWRSTPFRKKYRRHEQHLSNSIQGRRVLSGIPKTDDTYRYDESTGRIVEDDLFFYDYGVTSAVVQKTDSTFYGIYESDSLGRETARLMINDGRPIYKESCIYNKDTITFRSYSLENDDSSTKVIKYSFDSLGLLVGYEDEAFQWKYLRDAVGNVVTMDFGAGRTMFEIEYGERISRVGDDFDVLYDERTGYMTSRHEFRFEYDEFGRIVSTFKGDQLSSTFFYDDWDRRRLTQVFDNGFLITYQYERKDKPLLPTKVVRQHPDSSKQNTIRLFYDHLDRLFFVSVIEQELQYYVVTDLAGTPELVFDSETGRVVKTFLRSPYGVLIAEKGDPDLWIPIGYKGGIEEHSSGTVVIEGRAYDSHLGHFRTPDMDTFLDPTLILKNVRSIHSYKMDHPVTKLGVETLSLNNFESWISFLGLLTPKKLTRAYGKLPNAFESVLVQQHFEFRDGNVRFVPLHQGISHDTQLLGPDIIISFDDEDRRLTTRALRGAGTVETILSSLINGTILLESEDANKYDESSKIHLHFYRREYELPDNLELLKAGSIIPEINYLTPSRTMTLKIDVVKFLFTFWIGFDSVEEALASF